MRSAWLCVSLLCVLLSDLAEALPLYASIANTTFPLVVCRGLDAAVAELRHASSTSMRSGPPGWSATA
jgi:hypothetical protein